MDQRTRQTVASAILVALLAVSLALAWALPEDHTTDYLYEPVVERRA